MITTSVGTIFARVHDVPEDIDPDTGTRMEPAVQIEFDVVIGEEVRVMTSYVPREWTDTEVRESIRRTAHQLSECLGLPQDLDVNVIAYRHTADHPKGQ